MSRVGMAAATPLPLRTPDRLMQNDSGLVYVITESNRDTIIDTVNADLQALLDWGADNHTTFEPKKTHMMVVSKKESRAFDPTGIVMSGRPVGQEYGGIPSVSGFQI